MTQADSATLQPTIEPIAQGDEVEALLSGSALPIADLRGLSNLQLFGARAGGRLAGVVGIEVYDSVGLLRSLAVESASRRSGYGRALVAHAEHWSAQHAIETLYLLTTRAAGFFAHLGYEQMPRTEAPAAIAQTTEFAGLCPSSASLMRKRLVSISVRPG